jgi:hypothetical protein
MSAMKEAEIFTGLEAVTKIIADMIYGPAIIVMARGRIAWFMASPCLAAGGSCPAPSSSLHWPHNEGSILLRSQTVCAPEHQGSV